jgi:predicted metal-dependent hydrolase
MAKVIAVDLEVNTEKSEANLNDVVAVLGDIKKGLEGTKKATEENAKETKELQSNFKKAAAGVKGFGLALKAAGIGLAIEAFAMFKEVLGENQKVADFFATSVESLSIAFNDFFKFIENNLSSITGFFKDIFENPKENLEEFADAIKNNLIERFNSFLDTLGFLATAVKKVFERDFTGALEAVKQAGKESVDVLTGVNNSVDKVAEVLPKVTNAILDYAKSTYQAAAATIELNKQAEVAAVINQGLIEDYDRQAEQQRQIRDDTRNSLEVRIEANNKLGEILEEQQKLMLENADLILKAAENDLQKNNNQENYIKLLEAENEKKAVLAQIEGFRSEQLVNQAALQQEVADKVKEIDEAELKRKQEIAEKEIQLEKRKRESREMNALNAANTILGINSLFEGKTEEEQKKAFKRTKALNIAAALVETYLAAQKAFTSQIIPLDPTSPVRGGLAAAAAIAAGLGRVAQIRKQNFSGGSGGGGSTPISIGSIGSRNSNAAGVGFSPSTPTVNPIPTSSQIAAQGGQQSNVRAYVVQTDINNQTALDKRINQRATL